MEGASPISSTQTIVRAEDARSTGGLDRRYVTAALMLVMVLASMEQTVTSTAMPTIIGKLNGVEHYSWVASIYLLACTVSMPLYGRLADALGRKRVIMAAILLFTVASVLAASAHTMGQLILFRGFQGLGAGGIMPVVLTILGDIFTLEERAQIQGLFSVIWGTASLAGPALGAFLVAAFGWRSIFFVNLPFGFLGLAVLAWKYHDHEKPHSTDLDLPGVASLSLGCLALLALVSRLGPEGWSWPVALILVAVSVAAIIYFIIHERTAVNPILSPELIFRRSIGPALAASFLFGAGFLCLDTYVPLYVQGALGGGVKAAASVVTPVMLTWALSSFLAAPLLVRWGFRKTALMGSFLMLLGFLGLVICSKAHSSQHLITAVLALTGLGFGPASMAYLLAAQESVTWQQRGIVTSSITFFRTIGGSLGIGLLGAMFISLSWKPLHALPNGVSASTLLDPHAAASLDPSVREAAYSAVGQSLIWVFVAMLGMAAIQIVLTCFMPSRKADHAITAGEMMEAVG